MSEHAHIVGLPGFVTIIRIAQLVLDIVIIGLAGNTISGINKYNPGFTSAQLGLEPLGFMIFCCVWTLLVNAYLIVTPLWLPVAYNMWGHLTIEVISWIFWLSAWASVADWASAHSAWADLVGNTAFKYWATAAAAAAMGAIMWILYTVTLVFFCLRLHRHRTDPANAQLSKLGFAEKGENHQMGTIPQQHVQQPIGQEHQQHQYPEVTPSPTPVQYVATPPPQNWQQSPPPQGQY